MTILKNRYRTDGVIFTVNSKYFHVVTEFITTWKTDNLSAGSSESNQLRLPLTQTGSYDFVVYWGDGTQDHITSYNQIQTLHTYHHPGTYTICIFGVCDGWCVNNTGDRLKLIAVNQWGTGFSFGNQGGSFYGCSNLSISAIDTPLLQNITNLSDAFNGCSSIVSIPQVATWDVSHIQYLNRTFKNATQFKPNLANWSPLALLDAIDLFGGVNINDSDTTNYDALLASWSSKNVQTNVHLGGGSSRYSVGAGKPGRDILVNNKHWIIDDGDCMEQPSYEYRKCVVDIPAYSYEYRKCVVDVPSLTYEYRKCTVLAQ